MSSDQALRMQVRTKPTKKELEVLNVASDYFLSHGYKGTSINAMARDSGISKESIYRYFSSKKVLFEAVIAKELTEYKDRLQTLDFQFDSISLEEALRKTAESILAAVTTDRTLGLRRLIFQEARTAPDIGQYYYEVGPEEAYRNLQHIFELHRPERSPAPAQLANYFVSMVLHQLMLKRECGVTPPLSAKEIEAHAARVTSDFIDAFID